MEKLKELHELCETIMDEICEINKKTREGGMSAGDLETIDKLTHSLKSIKATIAMMEEEDEGMSGAEASYRYSRNGSYRGGSYRGRSYESGMSGRRDSMGRYARANESFLAAVENLMKKAPDEDTRRQLQDMKEHAEEEMLMR